MSSRSGKDLTVGNERSAYASAARSTGAQRDPGNTALGNLGIVVIMAISVP